MKSGSFMMNWLMMHLKSQNHQSKELLNKAVQVEPNVQESVLIDIELIAQAIKLYSILPNKLFREKKSNLHDVIWVYTFINFVKKLKQL